MIYIGKLKGNAIEQNKLMGTPIPGPYYIFQDTPIGATNEHYDDFTSIEAWHIIDQNQFDFMYIRDRIQEMVDAETWENVKPEEQAVAAQYFTVGATARNAIYDEATQLAYWEQYVDGMESSRIARWRSAKKYISFYINEAQSYELSQETKALSENYMTYGVIDLATSGADGLLDYLNGTSTYVGGGFPAKSYWTQAHQDKFNEILVTGLY